MKLVYNKRSLYCEWYEEKTLENVKNAVFRTIDKTGILYCIATTEEGKKEHINIKNVVRIEQ